MSEEATKKYTVTALVTYEVGFQADAFPGPDGQDIDAVTSVVRDDFLQHIRDFAGEDARISFELRPLEEEGVVWEHLLPPYEKRFIPMKGAAS